jgi:hypothetical protein
MIAETTTPKRRGRPRVAPEDSVEMPVYTLRLSAAHRAELAARGGPQAVRDWLERPVRRAAKGSAKP